MGQRLNKEYAGYSESGGEEGGLTSDSEILGPPFLHLEAVRIQLRKKKKRPSMPMWSGVDISLARLRSYNQNNLLSALNLGYFCCLVASLKKNQGKKKL